MSVSRGIRKLWQQQPGLLDGFVTDVLTTFALGSFMVTGGRDRTVAAAFSVINQNGGPELWGTFFLVLGVVMLGSIVFPPRFLGVVLGMAALYYVLVALFFGYAAAHDTGASWIGTVLFMKVAITHVSRGVIYLGGPR
ncbi:hypothetical protein LQ327_09070 [Actinomycetospora endophytica]|uniref:Uncharacterized protein n=1 Tax=Actinomycetospora endophytica TaxID=2291215 RepID=A0ABS8P5K3_9PSEU|nr:hypothetical protein [Actinomycetospora endophytica]MCD2193533.1 hypothetical protein [Actinomycetospora endophytica]